LSTSELQRADAAVRAEAERASTPYAKGEDLRQRLNARLDCIGWHYAETGTLPDFRTASPMTLLVGDPA